MLSFEEILLACRPILNLIYCIIYAYARVFLPNICDGGQDFQ